MNKKIITIILIFLIIFLSACDPAGYKFNIDELNNGLISIELGEYKNDNQKDFITWVPDYMDKLTSFDIKNLEIIEKLDNNKISLFTQQLSEQDILYRYYTYDYPKGLCIKLNYTNGDYIIINYEPEKSSFSGYIGKYDKNGNVLDYIGCFTSYISFESLVNDYFNKKI